MFYIKAGIKRTWLPLGATVLYGEYGQYNDQYSILTGTDCLLGYRHYQRLQEHL